MQVIIPNELTAAISGVISRGIRAAEVTQDGHLVLTLTDGSTADLGSVRGEQGEPGQPGPAGPQGAVGPASQRAIRAHRARPGAASRSWAITPRPPRLRRLCRRRRQATLMA